MVDQFGDIARPSHDIAATDDQHSSLSKRFERGTQRDVVAGWFGCVATVRPMQQIFPEGLDDVDVQSVYQADVRAPIGDRPWVMCNMISSVDGGIAVDGTSGGLGGDGDKAVFDALRSIPDVIIVASGTVIAEDYRAPQTPDDVEVARQARGQKRRPRLAIVTRSLSIEPRHQVFDADARPLIITTADSDETKRNELAAVADIVTAGQDDVDLLNALQQLREGGAETVLLEGGPTLNGAFVDADLVDELCLSFAPFLLGGGSTRIIAHSKVGKLRDLRLERTLHEDGTLFHRYVRHR